MFDFTLSDNIVDNYDTMLLMLKGQLEGEEDIIANLSNASAILMEVMKDINWAGFYLMKDEHLVLGPFQGSPACNRIKIGKGVCGTAIKTRKIQRVKDVHQFPGHIACDTRTNSEIVIPIEKDGYIIGVLDIDSIKFDRFSNIEEEYLKKFVDILNQNIKWERRAL